MKPTFSFDLVVSIGKANTAFTRIRKSFVDLERMVKFDRSVKRLKNRKRKHL